MLIVDTQAEQRLAALLESYLAKPTPGRVIHIRMDDAHRTDAKRVTDAALRFISNPNKQCYLSEDGAVFILAPTIQSKEARELALYLGEGWNKPVEDSWFGFFDLEQAALRILSEMQAMLQKKEAATRAFEEQEKKRHAETLAAQKKHAILNVPDGSVDSAHMADERRRRAKAEIMLVEDDAFSRRLVENVLGKDFTVTSLGTAEKALQTYLSHAPNVLFLDINLPDVTGHELLERIVKMDPDAYVIMLSGNADRENIMGAMERGAKGFVAKPFTREKLFQYIERCPTMPRKPS